MGAKALYKSLDGYLRVEARVVNIEGNRDITVGETFTIRFTGSNTAPSGPMTVVFTSARIRVRGTAFASTTSEGSHDLPEPVLNPGESSSIELEFEATRDLPGRDWGVREHVANVAITANLDLGTFFHFANWTEVRHEIRRT